MDKMMYMPHKLKSEYSILGVYLSAHPLDKFKFFINNSNITPLDEASKIIESKNSQAKMTIVGYVTKCAERIAKNGNIYGEFTIIDYKGELKFSLFRDDYSTYKSLLNEGYMVIIDVEIKERKFPNSKPADNKEKFYSVLYKNIRMLQNVKPKSINLQLLTDNIDKDFSAHFADTLKKCSGETEIYITLYSKYDMNRGIKLVSRSKQIDINNEEFENFILAHPDIIKKVIIKQ
jgi:DNA polymerase-3 subunit alpha